MRVAQDAKLGVEEAGGSGSSRLASLCSKIHSARMKASHSSPALNGTEAPGKDFLVPSVGRVRLPVVLPDEQEPCTMEPPAVAQALEHLAVDASNRDPDTPDSFASAAASEAGSNFSVVSYIPLGTDLPVSGNVHAPHDGQLGGEGQQFPPQQTLFGSAAAGHLEANGSASNVSEAGTLLCADACPQLPEGAACCWCLNPGCHMFHLGSPWGREHHEGPAAQSLCLLCPPSGRHKLSCLHSLSSNMTIYLLPVCACSIISSLQDSLYCNKRLHVLRIVQL